jgi:excisionase family DNA binding protein
MHADDLFTAPQVAKICSTDLKTIHNWVNRGEIKFFRTPGRHLRFRRQDILEFLGKYGYPVPDGFAPGRPRIVIIDDDEGRLRSLKRSLTKIAEVAAYRDHLDAMLAIGREQPSLVLVNGDGGPELLRVIERLGANGDSTPTAVFGSGNALEKRVRGFGAAFIGDTDTKQIKRRVQDILGL